MKTTAIALGMAMTVASSASIAGGIQIDPTGSGNIGSSHFLTNFGSSRGNMLFDGIMTTNPFSGLTEGTATGTVYAHNAFALDGPLSGFEISMNLIVPVETVITPGPGGNGSNFTSATWTSNGPTTFELYFGAANANMDTGANYKDGNPIASGIVEVAAGTGWDFTQLDGANAPIDTEASSAGDLSIRGSGQVLFFVDITSVDTNYVVNNISSLVLSPLGGDATTSNALTLRYPSGSTPPLLASDTFNGGAITPARGADGTNDFTCGGGTCDLQTLMNTTLTFNADRVPEPGSLALLGGSVLLMGAVARRRLGKSAV